MTAHDTSLWMRPSQPTADERAAFAAAARATLAERFSLLDAEDRPEEAFCELTPDEDIAIRPNSLVRVLASPETCPLFMRVLRVFCDDTLWVCLVNAPTVRTRLRVDEVTLCLMPECAAMEAG